MNPQEIVYELSANEHRRLWKRLYHSGILPYSYPVMALVVGGEFVTSAQAARYSFWTDVAVLSAAAGFGLMLTGIAIGRFRQLAVAGCITFSGSGISGIVDGATAALRWSDIARVRDLDDVLVVMRKHDGAAIAIPKASIPDWHALWDELEDRLISKRGLIRSGRPRKQIVNSAC